MKNTIVLLLALVGLILAPVMVQQAVAALPTPDSIVKGNDPRFQHHNNTGAPELHQVFTSR